MMIKQATRQLFSRRRNIFIFVAASLISMYMYYWALTYVLPVDNYIKNNTTLTILADLFVSILNSILVGLSVSMFVDIFVNRRKNNDLTIVQTGASLLLSLFSTGCYACGSVLLPAIGITTSFAALPFGGLEIKYMTALLLIYSLNELSKTVLGICELRNYKKLDLRIGENKYNLSSKLYYDSRPLFVTAFFIIAIFGLPMILPESDIHNAVYCAI